MMEGRERVERGGWRRLLLRGGRLHPVWRGTVYLVSFLAVEVTFEIVAGLVYVAVVLLTGQASPDLLEALLAGRLPRSLLLAAGWLRLGISLGLALLLGRLVDREPVATMGLEFSRTGRDGALGFVLGLGAMSAVAGIGLAAGWTHWERGAGNLGTLLLDLLALLPAAAAEEIVFRGYLLRAIGSWRGPAAGVGITSVLFVLFHGLNPNVTLLGLLNILLAGVVFALAVERAGTLWLAVGYHLAWNLAQGALLGLPVSGMAWDGLLALGTGGPPFWTGGQFGPEGGALATLVLLLSVLPLWALTRRSSSVAVAVENQRAALEARFWPLPHVHDDLEASARLFRDMARAPSRGRLGEVVLLLRRPDAKFLLHTKTFYPPEAYRLPSGGIKQGETVMEAARREAAEEAGLPLSDGRPLGLVTYTFRNGRKRFFFHSWVVVAEVEGEPTVVDKHERIEGFRWVGPEGVWQAGAALRSVPSEWENWGHFRALAHEAALRWLRQPAAES
jgi:membrane protease YdiL (CAAX protease family)/8-oxo-dGTP pyrophosphatase MutT (NUDIX family)